MHDQTDIYDIIAKYLNDSITREEQARLEAWISSSENNKVLFEQLTQRQFLAEELQKLYTYDEDKGWKQVQQHIAGTAQVIPVKRRPWRVWAVAASVTGLLVIAAYLFLNLRNSTTEERNTAVVQQDVAAPTTTKAMIRLANGQIVSLDSISSGVLAGQGSMQVIKNNDGQIVYQGTATDNMYNTLVNPRGGTVVSLVLHDGTRVWLNSESSLRYPIAFNGKERRVEITGEAYFEVAKNPAKKFTVTGNGVQTEVLGTHFNINTYRDEERIRVTLVEGKVKVNAASSVVLKPGEQASISHSSQPIAVQTVDTDRVIAWTNGVFSFDEEDLPAVMRQLARWYDVEVSFNSAVPNEHYSGIFSRQLTLSKVLAVLRTAGVKYTIEGKKLMIEKAE